MTHASSIPSQRGLLTNKVALVLGASRGIGASAALALARAGARVVVAARDTRGLDRGIGDQAARRAYRRERAPSAGGLIPAATSTRCSRTASRAVTGSRARTALTSFLCCRR
jgi:NAD(P)-dependent dehydrogenase (short-subunit alcohol dehydrogenase family)